MPDNVMLSEADITLPLAEIQGDVLIGLKKNAEFFVFFAIADAAKFRTALGAIFEDITFTDQMKAVEEAKQRGEPVPVFLGLNFAFTATGLGKLHPGEDLSGLDPSFLAGAAASRAALGDVATWLPEYEQPIDGVFLATGIDLQTATDHADAVRHTLRHSIHMVRAEPGLVRTGGQKGHEHFGFEDGISQPGVRGLTAPGSGPGANRDQGLPGQDLIEPGDFLLGYPMEGGGVSPAPRPWMKNGSYLVFRRLNQDVAGFDAYLASQAPASGLSADQLGAHLIGRWKSGAPVVITSLVDDPVLAADPTRNNDFEFGSDAAHPTQDPHQQKCPYVAHIRKVYPREDFPGESEKRRIIRAGIPFGRDGDADKGLLFACYQSSIVDKFEFLQTAWANNPSFMFGKTSSNNSPITPGRDIAIGQDGPRTPVVGDVPQRTLGDAPPFVTATGAVYLFSPSRSALQAIVHG